MRIAIACGGTGGHVFPGLATADYLQRQGHDVALWLSGRNVEDMAVKGWPGPVHRIAVTGLALGSPVKCLAALYKMLRAYRMCRRLMRGQRPDVVLGMGSYACVAPVLAARSLGIPYVLHESNAVPGRAVVFLSRWAAAVGLVFESARQDIKGGRIEITGFPVRSELEHPAHAEVPAHDGLTVLVMGGSQGSAKLNEVCAGAICRLHAEGVDLNVIHLSGGREAECVKAKYLRAGVRHEVHAFWSDMAGAYVRADVAISRAGASACAELAVCNVPALLVPLPHARRDHQTANARALAAGGGAVVIPEKSFTIEALIDFLRQCATQPEKLEKMRSGLAALAVRGGAGKLAGLTLAAASLQSDTQRH